MDEDEYGEISPEDEFASGDDIILWSADRGMEIGFLLGFSDHGLIWRRTHTTVTTGPGKNDWEFSALNRSILTFSRWDTIERLESHAEIAEEHELGKFNDLLDDVNDTEDFVAVVEAASETDDES